MKEYHVWDAVYGTDEQGPPPLEGEDTAEREALRNKLIADPEKYFEYFERLLDQPDIILAADITPAYAALPALALERIRDGFHARGIDVKVVFLMRDPVERCWSAARMYRRKRLDLQRLDPALDEPEFVLAYAQTLHAQRRGRYEQTVASVERAFVADQIFYGFHETLFDDHTVASLSDFLGVAPRPDLADRTFNVSPKGAGLPDEIQSAIARFYGETLRFCRERFPESAALWSSYSLVT